MSAKNDFEERTYDFAKKLVLFLGQYEFKRTHLPIVQQVIRSATSIGANIIEGKSGNSKRNLINFFSISLRSANETKFWLRLIKDTCSVDVHQVDVLISECIEFSKILARSIMTMKKNLEKTRIVR